MNEKINVLVTGANGQLGLTLKSKQNDLKNVDFHFYDSKELDITKKGRLSQIVKESNFAYCINCAAYTNVERAEKFQEQAYAVNSKGVENLVDAFKDRETILIHISTDYVFDGEKKTPYFENEITNPINIYGKSKLKGEIVIQEHLERFFIIRTSWLYSKFGNNFLKTVLFNLINGKNMKISSMEKGVPTSCNSLSEFILFLINKKINEFGLYQFTARGQTNWCEYAKYIREIIMKASISSGDINCIEHFKTIAKRPKNSVLDISKAKKLYPKINYWKEDIESVVQVIIQNHLK